MIREKGGRTMNSSFPEVRGIKELYSEEDIQKVVQEAAVRIMGKYLPLLKREGDDFKLIFVAVLSGAIRYRTALADEVGLRLARAGYYGCIQEDEVSVSSYLNDTEPQEIRFLLDTKRSIAGAHVVLVEDIIDTGITASCIINLLRAKKPVDLDLYILIDKTPRREKAVQPVYVGFQLTEDLYVVGFGLDKDGRFRELPFIGYASEENNH
jgi:hypoxanthine phosphoribosyltransferase